MNGADVARVDVIIAGVAVIRVEDVNMHSRRRGEVGAVARIAGVGDGTAPLEIGTVEFAVICPRASRRDGRRIGDLAAAVGIDLMNGADVARFNIITAGIGVILVEHVDMHLRSRREVGAVARIAGMIDGSGIVIRRTVSQHISVGKRSLGVLCVLMHLAVGVSFDDLQITPGHTGDNAHMGRVALGMTVTVIHDVAAPGGIASPVVRAIVPAIVVLEPIHADVAACVPGDNRRGNTGFVGAPAHKHRAPGGSGKAAAVPCAVFRSAAVGIAYLRFGDGDDVFQLIAGVGVRIGVIGGIGIHRCSEFPSGHQHSQHGKNQHQ